MKAIVITRPGGPEVLALREVPDPKPARDEVLVRVAAAGVNRADLLQRAGGYPAPAGWPSDIPGLEYAGVVEAVGHGVTRWRPGDRLMGLVGGGAYAELVAVHEATALPVPAGLTLVAASAIPEAFLTAHDALFTQAELRPGKTLLVHGVGSGVGTAALQLGAAKGARVLGTSRSAWKLERAAELGLAVGIDATSDDFVVVVLRETDGRGADVVLDLVGGPYLIGNMRALAVGGRVEVIGLVAGARAELDMALLLRKRAIVRGSTMRPRALPERIAVAERFRSDALASFDAGALWPVIDEVMPAAKASAAHERIASNTNFGKIVLTWD